MPVEEEYKSFFPVVDGLLPTIKQIFAQFDLKAPFIDLEADIKNIVKAFVKQAPNMNSRNHQMRFDILKAPFYRNKAAYIVGRIVSKNGVQPFIIPILHNKSKGLFIDAVLTNSVQMRVVFGFARWPFPRAPDSGAVTTAFPGTAFWPVVLSVDVGRPASLSCVLSGASSCCCLLGSTAYCFTLPGVAVPRASIKACT